MVTALRDALLPNLWSPGFRSISIRQVELLESWERKGHGGAKAGLIAPAETFEGESRPDARGNL